MENSLLPPEAKATLMSGSGPGGTKDKDKRLMAVTSSIE